MTWFFLHLLACVVEPSPGIWLQFEPDPALVGGETDVFGVWEDGSVVLAGLGGDWEVRGPDAASSTFAFPTTLMWVLPDGSLAGWDDQARLVGSRDRGQTWDLIQPSRVTGGFNCCSVTAAGALIGFERMGEGDKWDVWMSRNAGRDWENATVNAPAGTLTSVLDGYAVVSYSDERGGGIARWKLPGGRVERIPYDQAWLGQAPFWGSPDGAVVLFPVRPWFEPPGVLDVSWAKSWRPNGAVTDLGPVHTRGLAVGTREVLGVGWDGRLRVLVTPDFNAPEGSVPTVFRSIQPLRPDNGGREAILAGPGCSELYWLDLDFELDEGVSEGNRSFPVTNGTDAEVRMWRTNCTGYCSDWDAVIAPGETRDIPSAMGSYLFAEDAAGTCLGVYPLDQDDLAITVAPL